MIQSLEKIEYRRGMLKKSKKRESLPVKVRWRRVMKRGGLRTESQ